MRIVGPVTRQMSCKSSSDCNCYSSITLTTDCLGILLPPLLQYAASSVIGPVHARYINILTWLRGFRVKIVTFLSFFCLSIPKRDLDTKKTSPDIQVCPESLGAMLEY